MDCKSDLRRVPGGTEQVQGSKPNIGADQVFASDRECVMALKSFVPALYILAAAGFYLCLAQANPHAAQPKVWPVDALLHPLNPPATAHKHAADPARAGVPLQANQQSVHNSVTTAPAAVTPSRPA
jgi:hypothetical protein